MKFTKEMFPMENTILQTLFLDNPEISGEIARFCDSLPEYVQAERDFQQAVRELEALIGYERYIRFEEAMTWHMFLENRAYYLFGLKLRRDILEGIAG